jgi:HEAT repeat protein
VARRAQAKTWVLRSASNSADGSGRGGAGSAIAGFMRRCAWVAIAAGPPAFALSLWLAWLAVRTDAPIYDGKTAAEWLGMSESPEPTWREAAAYALVRLSQGSRERDAVRTVELRMLGDPSEDVRIEAADGLIALARSSADTARLITILGNVVTSQADSAAWEDAAHLLGRLGTRAELAVPALTALLASSHPTVRSAAVAALADIGGPDGSELTRVSALATDTDAGVRQAVIAALLELDAGPSFVLSVGLRGLVDRDPAVREQAAYALGALRPVPVTAVTPLIDALSDSEQNVRVAAASALAAAPPGSVARWTLQRAAAGRDSTARRAARALLSKADPTQPRQFR